MVIKVVLSLACVAQVIAAGLAFRLNIRYRIYSAWLLVSAAAMVGAIVTMATLADIWVTDPTIVGNWKLWTAVLASLVEAGFLLAAMSLIEPFFMQLARMEDTLRREHDQLESEMRYTQDELRLAQSIQRQLLPESAPEIPNVDVFGDAYPAEWTSGDYYDYLDLEGDAMAIVIADVSGHGLGPALLMSSTRASFRALAPHVCDVGDLLTQGNLAVIDAVSGRRFVTAFVVRLDFEHHKAYYATAGHSAYLLRHDGKREVLAATHPPLGVMFDLKVETEEIHDIQPGDLLLLITDGVPETYNSKDEMFGEDRLWEIIEQRRHDSARDIVQATFDAAREFAGGLPQHDDYTAVVVKFS